MKLYHLYTNDYRVGQVYVIASNSDEAEKKLLETVKRENPYFRVRVNRIDVLASDGMNEKTNTIDTDNKLIM